VARRDLGIGAWDRRGDWERGEMDGEGREEIIEGKENGSGEGIEEQDHAFSYCLFYFAKELGMCTVMLSLLAHVGPRLELVLQWFNPVQSFSSTTHVIYIK
jgi:hypothetical protein